MKKKLLTILLSVFMIMTSFTTRVFALVEGNNIYTDAYESNAHINPSSGELTFVIKSINGCTSLTSFSIPSNVSSIEGGAFYDCSSLSNIKIESIIPPSLGSSVFSNCNANLKILVPLASCEYYINEDSNISKGWYAYKDIIDAYVTVADLLIDFPDSPEDGWVNENGAKAYINGDNLSVSTSIPLNSILQKDGDNFKYISGNIKCTFVMSSGELSSIEVEGNIPLPPNPNGVYSPYEYKNPTKNIQVGSTEDVEFETNAVYVNASDVTVKVDGNTLTLNTHYTQYQGSTHVILKGSYLSTLAAGTHTITIGVTGYSDINQDFTITAAPSPTPDPDPTPRYTIPNTGVEGTTNNHSLLKLSSLSLLAIGTYIVIKKKKDND